MVSSRGFFKVPKSVKRLIDFERPTNLQEVAYLVHLSNFCAAHILGFARLVAPLRNLLRTLESTGKKREQKKILLDERTWTPQLQLIVEKVKQEIQNQLVFNYPKKNYLQAIFADASEIGYAAVLVQFPESQKSLPWYERDLEIIYALSGDFHSHKSLHVSMKEVFALHAGVVEFQKFFNGGEIEAYTDNEPLTKISFPDSIIAQRRLDRFLLKFKEVKLKIHHIPGSWNKLCDYISRHAERLRGILPVAPKPVTRVNAMVTRSMDKKGGKSSRARSATVKKSKVVRPKRKLAKRRTTRVGIPTVLPETHFVTEQPIADRLTVMEGEPVAVEALAVDSNVVSQPVVQARETLDESQEEADSGPLVAVKTESNNAVYVPTRMLNCVIQATDKTEAPSLEAIFRDGVWLVPDRRGFQKVYVPLAVRSQVIGLTHSLEAGHPGKSATISNLRQMFLWPGLDHDVSVFVRECLDCQTVKSHPKHVDMGRVLRGKQPFEIVAVDHCDMGRSTDGYSDCLVVICCFSGHIYVEPVVDKRAVTTATALIKYAQTYVVPKLLVCDNGSAFINEVVSHFTRVMGIGLSPTMPYCQWSNICEGAVKRVKQVFKHFILQHRIPRSDWNNCAKSVQSILNNTPLPTLGGYSASSLVFRSSRLTPQLYTDSKEELQPIGLNVKVTRFVQESRAQITKVLQDIDERFKDEEVIVKKELLQVNSLVLVISDLYSKQVMKPPAFSLKHDKICVIIKRNHAFSYVLQELSTGLISTEHVSRLHVLKASMNGENVLISKETLDSATHLTFYRHGIDKILSYEFGEGLNPVDPSKPEKKRILAYATILKSSGETKRMSIATLIPSLGGLIVSDFAEWVNNLSGQDISRGIEIIRHLQGKLDYLIGKMEKDNLGRKLEDGEKKTVFSFTRKGACNESSSLVLSTSGPHKFLDIDKSETNKRHDSVTYLNENS